MNEVIPGINEEEWGEIEKKLNTALKFAHSIHIDLKDGIFVEGKTYMNPDPFKDFTQKALFELHMMVDNPLQYLNAWSDAGFERFIGHIEKMPDPVEFVAQAQLKGAVGLAIDADTDIDILNDINLNDLDTLLIMTIKAGPSGQALQEKLLEKVRRIKNKAPYLPIEVDGGINIETITMAKDAGACRFISTSYIFNSDNPKDSFQRLHETIMR
jgi:ribulose-phosphate 3-epimerase